jgi:hypothetical protein
MISALSIARRWMEVMPRLLWPSWALDDDQRHAFAGQLDGMGVPDLVRRGAPTDAGRAGGPAQVRSWGGAGPVPGSRGTVDDAEQGTDR